MTEQTIQPEVPDLKALGIQAVPDPVPGIRCAFLRLDPEAGTLTLRAESTKATDVVVPLADVTGLVRVRYANFIQTVPAARLLVLGKDGRCLASTRRLVEPVFDATWTDAALAGVGLLRPDERYRGTRRLQKVHPGAAPRWYLSTFPYNFLLLTSVLLLLLVILFLLTS